ncbi:MAG: DUF1365 domain-containing protein [Rhodocyclaceae bacterium]|nr:DUF1365 domain-containing protein [Rhodocyclaceae bacterium]
MSGGAFAPTVGFGTVVHVRHAPVEHRFAYPIAFLRVPLAALAGLRVPLLGIDRFNLFSLRAADHGARDGSDPARWLHVLLAEHGLAGAADGPVMLQTFPRILGYVFNPVSFWFCHDRSGALRVVVAEVNNTFGERHAYVVAHPDRRPIVPGDRLTVRKRFHVSPFFPVAGEYRFAFDVSDGHSRVALDYFEGGRRVLSTALSGRLQALDGAAMGRWLLRFPLMSFLVMGRIHWQALRLWRKRVPFFRKPDAPLTRSSS